MSNPYGAAYAVSQTEIGIGLEATRGTGVAASYWFGVKAPKYKPDRSYLMDNTLQGSMVTNYSATPGMRYDAHGWDGYVYLDSFPILIAMELGSTDTVTTAPTNTTVATGSPVAVGATTIVLTAGSTYIAGSFFTIGTAALGNIETCKVLSVSTNTVTLVSPTVYAHAAGVTVTGLTKHRWSLLNNGGAGNQPPSGSIWDYDGEEYRQLTASQMDKLTIKGNATALIDYTTDFYCNPAITPSTPSPSYTTVKPVPSWTTKLIIGSTQYTDVEEFEIGLSRGTKPIPAFTGTLEYFQYFAGPLTPTFKVTVVETTGAPELTAYQNGVNQAMDFVMNDVVTGYAMEIHSSSTLFTTGELSRSKEYVEAELTGDFFPTSTDALAGGVSPLVVTVANGTASAYN